MCHCFIILFYECIVLLEKIKSSPKMLDTGDTAPLNMRNNRMVKTAFQLYRNSRLDLMAG